MEYQPQTTASPGPKTFTGSLAGSPLKPASLMILGINWGGGGPRDSHVHAWTPEPIECGLVDRAGGFDLQIQHVLNRAVKDQVVVTELLQRETFWTNRLLVRSAQITAKAVDEEGLLKDSMGPSSTAIAAMIEIVRPKVLICFGNSHQWHSPSRYVLSDLGHLTNWKNEGDTFAIKRKKTTGYARLFTNVALDLNGRKIVVPAVWSLPHPLYWYTQMGESEELLRRLESTLSA